MNYYKNKTDETPVGSIYLTNLYCVFPNEEEEKGLNSFVVGPLVAGDEDDKRRAEAMRKYQIYAESEADMDEWMRIIEACIEGKDEAASVGRTRAHSQSHIETPEAPLGAGAEQLSFQSLAKRAVFELLELSERGTFKHHTDCGTQGNGCTYSRGSFDQSAKPYCPGLAIKIEGELDCSVQSLTTFLSMALETNGKLDK